MLSAAVLISALKVQLFLWYNRRTKTPFGTRIEYPDSAIDTSLLMTSVPHKKPEDKIVCKCILYYVSMVTKKMTIY